MKKHFKVYCLVWALLLGLFNLIVFIVPPIFEQEKYVPTFWIEYALITAVFGIQLYCAYIVIKSKNSKELFYRMSLVTSGYVKLLIYFVISLLCILFIQPPYWIGGVVCATILVFNIISVVKAKTLVDEVERIDNKVKVQTFFIKSLTADAEALCAVASTDEIKEECRKVKEAIRYSDPMSNDSLALVETEITLKFSAFCDAVKENDIDAVKATGKEVIVLMELRNKKCMLLK